MLHKIEQFLESHRMLCIRSASVFAWVAAVGVAVLPNLVFAGPATLGESIKHAQRLVATAIPPILGLALLSFFWGIIQYLSASRKSPDAAIKGRSVLLWGVIVLFVMVSLWGIVRIVRTTFGI